jgi:hypothetical protein
MKKVEMILAYAYVVQIGTESNFDHYHAENISFIRLSLLQPLSYPPSDLARCQGILLISLQVLRDIHCNSHFDRT